MKPFVVILFMVISGNGIAQNNLKEILAIKAAFDSLNSSTFRKICKDTINPTDDSYAVLHKNELRRFKKGKIKELKPDVLDVYFISGDACLLPFEHYLKLDSFFRPGYNAYSYTRDTLKFYWVYGPPKECQSLVTAVATILAKGNISIEFYDSPGSIPWGWFLKGETQLVEVHVNEDYSVQFIRSWGIIHN